MHNALPMEIVEADGRLGYEEADGLLCHVPCPVEVEAQVPSEHEIEDHEEVLVILEGVSQVAHKQAVNLFEETAFLDDVLHGVLLDAALEAADGSEADQIRSVGRVHKGQCKGISPRRFPAVLPCSLAHPFKGVPPSQHEASDGRSSPGCCGRRVADVWRSPDSQPC